MACTPGQPVWVGLQLAHQPEWHTYWKNSGDSGLPTQLQWTLPPGVMAGDIAWPVPKKIPIGTLANYGYEGTVLLPVPLTITPDFKPSLLGGDMEVKLKASWLVCKKECIPEEGEFALKIPARSTTALNAPAFEAAFDAQPKPLAGGRSPTARRGSTAMRSSSRVQGLPVALRGKTLEFFPETGEVIETAAQWTQAWNGDTWTAQVPLSPQRSASPAVMPVVLAAGGAGLARRSSRSLGQWPAGRGGNRRVAGAGSALRGNAAAGSPRHRSTLPPRCWARLLGGLILNLMPCVFPVLAIKVVGFTRHADDRRGHRISGLAYTAGVVVSFVALGALMLALRAAGEQLGWGFQLQSPAVVAALAALFTADRAEPGGPVRVRRLPAVQPGLAGSAPSGGQRLPVRRAGGGDRLALHRALHGRIARPRDRPAGRRRRWRSSPRIGVGMALPYLAASWVPAVARAAAAARRLDGRPSAS